MVGFVGMEYIDDNTGIKQEVPVDVQIFWRPSVYAVITKGDSILMVKLPFGLRSLPGGGMNKDESVKQALNREVLEETGYQVSKSELFDTAERYLHIDKDDRYYHVIAMMFQVNINEAKQVDPESMADGEVLSMEWVKLSDLNKDNCHELFLSTIKKYESSESTVTNQV